MKTLLSIVLLVAAMVRLEAALPVYNFTADIRFNSLPPMGNQEFLHAVPNTAECYWTNIYTKTVTTGDNTIYTVPAGMRFFPIRCQARALTNSTLITTGVITNGVIRPTNITVPLGTNGTTVSFRLLVFDEGESVNINTTGALPGVYLNGLVFTNTIGLKSPRVYPVAGDNTIYTVPANRSAITFYGVEGHGFYYNGSVSTVALGWYYVPNGETISANTLLLSASAAPGTATGTITTGIPVMSAGDSFSINVDSSSAGQFAWITILETP